MATEPLNPYAPSETLAHEAAKPTRPGPGRFASLVLAILAYPLTGAGFYVLGRPRRLVRWIAVGFLTWVPMIVAVRFQLPKLCVFAFAANLVATVAALVDLVVAGPLAAPKGRVLLIAVLLVIAARGGQFAAKRWLAEGFQIPSGAMMPTLLVGDRIMAKKGRGIVHRGDIVVFEFPQDRSTDYVKRAVAIGGDTIQVTDGIVSINGVALKHEELKGECPALEEPAPCKLMRETNTGRSYTIMLMSDRSASDSPRIVVPEGHVFVLGDNRDNSYDSRKWGFVPVDHIKAVPTLTWWSTEGKDRIRWSRVGRSVE